MTRLLEGVHDMTISTHNGSQVARDHNIRNRKITDKEEHIDRNGTYEIWHDEKPREAYKRLFEESVKEFNTRQKNKERIIDDYYTKIAKDPKKHPVYEMIVAIGSKKEKPDADTGKEILREFVDGWKERNPNLEMIGAYYHADEEGIPHVHIDYIPVAYENTRGMKVQNALKQGLKEQGFEGKSAKLTAQMMWEKRENAHLEKLCRERGLKIEHKPTEEKLKHVDRKTYIAIQKQKEEILDKAEYTKMKEKKPSIGGVYKYTPEEHEKLMNSVRYYDKLIEAKKEVERQSREIAKKEKELEKKAIELENQRMRQGELWTKLFEVKGRTKTENKDTIKLRIYEDITKSLKYGDSNKSVYEALFKPLYRKEKEELIELADKVFERDSLR